MKVLQSLPVTLLIAMASLAASAQTAAEHEQHHPGGAAPATASPAPRTAEQQMSAMDTQLQRMRDMSHKLAAAKTPQERQALMIEHQKTMQESMRMMSQMQGLSMGGMGGIGMMMGGGAGMPSSASNAPPVAPDANAASAAPAMRPQMMAGMMQRHTMMEKRMEMMQMMMDRMPASSPR
ncbi:hypothetical protein AZ34_14700 [Hylemonella gracilis str. Niagara R]|uniref:Uncharacterized protein n=1 Tax=Hylemonella gracilis str. Niagara R TaxID=1458275 RepID=A0A016XK10_9BURK|nr:hypothetical protein [Hylemonella gracilis]EYC52176.1 hypothetical protein AZ34_14700 [Hylemonella gracilis str. Niagara R]